jgi:hypothetical protein
MRVGGQLHAPAALPPGKRPGTHCTGGWVGRRAGLDGCGKSRPPTGIRSPDRPARSESLYRLLYPGSHKYYDGWICRWHPIRVLCWWRPGKIHTDHCYICCLEWARSVLSWTCLVKIQVDFKFTYHSVPSYSWVYGQWERSEAVRLLGTVGTRHRATTQLVCVVLWDYRKRGATGGVLRHRFNSESREMELERERLVSFILCVPWLPVCRRMLFYLLRN